MGIREMLGQKPDPRAQELADLETVVQRGMSVWIEVAEALARIRDKQLYRLNHDTFEDYVQQRWTMKASRAYQLIRAGAVAKNLDQGTHAPAPTSERQVRPLTQLNPDQQREAWKAATDAAPKDDDGTPIITAAAVEEAAATVKPRKKRKQLKAIRIKVPGGIVVIERRRPDLTAEQALADALTILARKREAA